MYKHDTRSVIGYLTNALHLSKER